MAEFKTAFLSSTRKDLAEYRKAVEEAIEHLDGWKWIGMERFGARDTRWDDFCREEVRKSNLFVGILGHCHGSCPEGSDLSFTEREYEEARNQGRPRLMYLASDDFPIPANLVEPDEKRAKQQAFRQRVKLAEGSNWGFESPDRLAALVVSGIHNHVREQESSGKMLVGGDGSLGRSAEAEAYVNAVCEYAIGRQSEQDELRHWLKILDQPQGPTAIVNDIERSTEARRHLVGNWYQQHLGRPPKNNEESNWVQMLLHGASEERVLAGILESKEFFTKRVPIITNEDHQSPTSDKFVRALYKHLLGREPDHNGFRNWCMKLPQLGRMGVAFGILSSNEYRRRVVTSISSRFGDTESAEEQLNHWASSSLDLTSLRIEMISTVGFRTLVA